MNFSFSSENPSAPGVITPRKHTGNHDPEVALMLRVQQGSAEAFDELVRLYGPLLTRRFSSMWGLREVAEDLSQDVLLRVYRARGTWAPTAALRTWIGRIALNVARNAVRRMRRELADCDAADITILRRFPAPSQLPTGEAILQRLIANEQSSDLVSLLDRLPERQRTALRMLALEGRTSAATTKELGLTPAALKSLVARARTALRREVRRATQLASGHPGTSRSQPDGRRSSVGQS